MRAAFAIAALAGAAIAAPSYGAGYGNQEEPKKNLVVVVETFTETCYVTGEPTATPTSVAVPSAAKPTGPSAPVQPPSSPPVYEAPAPAPPAPAPPVYSPPAQSPTPAPAPAPKPSPDPQPQPQPQPAPPANNGYMAVVSEWRAKLGLSDLAHDSKLEQNAKQVVIIGNGVMKHNLLDGTFGQVLAPVLEDRYNHGYDTFTKAFVGGWLCEKPGLKGLEGVCQGNMADGWDVKGQTGHADILTSPQYSKIGCAEHMKIWCCDLA